MSGSETQDRPDWARQVQPDPPNFGQAKLVSERRLAFEVARRRRRAERVLHDAHGIVEFEPGLVSLVVLTCKRPQTLWRLTDSLLPFLRDVETYEAIERVLVDNGTGPEVTGPAAELFDEVIAHERNLGMLPALRDAFERVRGEYVLLVEDDFLLDFDRPFLQTCIDVFDEFPEIGIVRLKNQNNWWKPHRRIAPLRRTSTGAEFWTWLPGYRGMLNGWAAGSVLFRRVAYASVGQLPDAPQVPRSSRDNHAYLYEYVYGRRFNRRWLAAKVKGVYPFVQPNDTPESPGWADAG